MTRQPIGLSLTFSIALAVIVCYANGHEEFYQPYSRRNFNWDRNDEFFVAKRNSRERTFARDNSVGRDYLYNFTGYDNEEASHSRSLVEPSKIDTTTKKVPQSVMFWNPRPKNRWAKSRWKYGYSEERLYSDVKPCIEFYLAALKARDPPQFRDGKTTDFGYREIFMGFFRYLRTNYVEVKQGKFNYEIQGLVVGKNGEFREVFFMMPCFGILEDINPSSTSKPEPRKKKKKKSLLSVGLSKRAVSYHDEGGDGHGKKWDPVPPGERKKIIEHCEDSYKNQVQYRYRSPVRTVYPAFSAPVPGRDSKELQLFIMMQDDTWDIRFNYYPCLSMNTTG